MPTTTPLSGQGTPINYQRAGDTITVTWGETGFTLTDANISQILNEFFTDPDHWYPLGASMTNPPPGGLGQFVADHLAGLSPRHASAIAAILVHLELLQSRGESPIELKKT